jgi:hypothetical protein
MSRFCTIVSIFIIIILFCNLNITKSKAQECEVVISLDPQRLSPNEKSKLTIDLNTNGFNSITSATLVLNIDSELEVREDEFFADGFLEAATIIPNPGEKGEYIIDFDEYITNENHATASIPVIPKAKGDYYIELKSLVLFDDEDDRIPIEVLQKSVQLICEEKSVEVIPPLVTPPLVMPNECIKIKQSIHEYIYTPIEFKANLTDCGSVSYIELSLDDKRIKYWENYLSVSHVFTDLKPGPHEVKVGAVINNHFEEKKGNIFIEDFSSLNFSLKKIINQEIKGINGNEFFDIELECLNSYRIDIENLSILMKLNDGFNFSNRSYSFDVAKKIRPGATYTWLARIEKDTNNNISLSPNITYSFNYNGNKINDLGKINIIEEPNVPVRSGSGSILDIINSIFENIFLKYILSLILPIIGGLLLTIIKRNELIMEIISSYSEEEYDSAQEFCDANKKELIHSFVFYYYSALIKMQKGSLLADVLKCFADALKHYPPNILEKAQIIIYFKYLKLRKFDIEYKFPELDLLLREEDLIDHEGFLIKLKTTEDPTLSILSEKLKESPNGLEYNKNKKSLKNLVMELNKFLILYDISNKNLIDNYNKLDHDAIIENIIINRLELSKLLPGIIPEIKYYKYKNKKYDLAKMRALAE